MLRKFISTFLRHVLSLICLSNFFFMVDSPFSILVYFILLKNWSSPRGSANSFVVDSTLPDQLLYHMLSICIVC